VDESSQFHSQRYLVYDSKTGAVISAYEVHAPASEAMPTQEEVREQLRGLLDDEALQGVEVLEDKSGSPYVQHFVDPTRRELRTLREIDVRAEKSELDADGEDSTELEIVVRDPDTGAVDESFSGALVVTTTRGRLSERGGRVDARQGRASIRLLSAVETVREVQVIVEDPRGRAVPGIVTLEFA
jgi:hypothetical protein